MRTSFGTRVFSVVHMTNPDLPPQQPNQTPPPFTRPRLDGEVLPALAPLQGRPLNPIESAVLLASANEGLRALQQMSVAPSRTSTGGELELTILDERGDPLPKCSEVLWEFEQAGSEHGTATPEYPKFDIELNSLPIIGLQGDFLRTFEQQLTALARQASDAAKRCGGRLASVGILPSIFPEHLGGEYITRKQRYADLGAALREERLRYPDGFHFHYNSQRGRFEIELDPQGLHIRGPRRGEIVEPRFLDAEARAMTEYSALNTSFQVHWGVKDQSRYVEAHRIADLISAVMVGITANSPILHGQAAGPKEVRLWVYISGLHKRRVNISEQYLAHPLSQLEDALRCGVILGARGSKLESQQMSHLVALQLLSGTTWPLNRTVVSTNEAKTARELRIEHRPISAQPTIADTVGAAALFYGLMAGMPEYLKGLGIECGEHVSPQELDKRLPYRHVMNNVGRACIDGLQSKIVWFDGRRVEIRELVMNELLPVAKDGLRSLGVPESDVRRYLGGIERRLSGRLGDLLGLTPADLLRDVSFAAEDDGLDPRASGRKLALWLAEAFETPPGDQFVGLYDLWKAKYRPHMK